MIIRPDLFVVRSAIVALFFVITGLGFCQDKENVPAPDKQIPPLMDYIRFSGEIQFCGIRIPKEIQDIRQRLEKEVLLAVDDRPQVILWLKRSSQFFPYLERKLKQENLPLDLKYVPVIESALRPHSNSAKGAIGYWQFLKSTGKRYGLRIDDKIDDRKNFFNSTQAACAYLKDLNTEFGSWLLALAAYNMGEFGLNAEIDAQENRDFFSLYLPLETQQYVFKMIAAKMILENPEKYGFFLTPADFYPEIRFSKINFNLHTQVPILMVAQAANISFKTIKDMNPEIRGYTLDPGKITLVVPEGNEKEFKERFSKLYAEWPQKHKTKIHVVRPGESLIGIAQTYNMSLPSLLRLNNFAFKQVIHPGDRLRVR